MRILGIASRERLIGAGIAPFADWMAPCKPPGRQMQTEGRPAEIQENQYAFPYHYIPSEDGGFRHALSLSWSYEYQSYLRFVVDRLSDLAWEDLLDVGCGDGRLVYEVNRRLPARHAVGIDMSVRAIRQAQAMNPAGHYLSGDVSDGSNFDRSFDVVTLVEVLEHIPLERIETFVAGVKQRLRPSGLLLLTVPSKNMPLSPKHHQHFTLESLSAALQPHFRIVEHEFINQQSVFLRAVQTALVNSVFIFRERHVLTALLAMYRRFCLKANSDTGRRIVALCARSTGE